MRRKHQQHTPTPPPPHQPLRKTIKIVTAALALAALTLSLTGTSLSGSPAGIPAPSRPTAPSSAPQRHPPSAASTSSNAAADDKMRRARDFFNENVHKPENAEERAELQEYVMRVSPKFDTMREGEDLPQHNIPRIAERDLARYGDPDVPVSEKVHFIQEQQHLVSPFRPTPLSNEALRKELDRELVSKELDMCQAVDDDKVCLRKVMPMVHQKKELLGDMANRKWATGPQVVVEQDRATPSSVPTSIPVDLEAVGRGGTTKAYMSSSHPGYVFKKLIDEKRVDELAPPAFVESDAAEKGLFAPVHKLPGGWSTQERAKYHEAAPRRLILRLPQKEAQVEALAAYRDFMRRLHAQYYVFDANQKNIGVFQNPDGSLYYNLLDSGGLVPKKRE